MLIEAKKLIGLPVASMDTQAKIATIREILIDPENGRFLGFLVSSGGIFAKPTVLSTIDIRDWDPNGIVTESVDNLVPPEEIIRIKEVLDQKVLILGMKAKTESGKGLGIVENLLLDSETGSIAKYYLKDLLGNSRILTSDKVIKIDKQITFADDVGEIPTGAQGVAA